MRRYKKKYHRLISLFTAASFGATPPEKPAETTATRRLLTVIHHDAAAAPAAAPAATAQLQQKVRQMKFKEGEKSVYSVRRIFRRKVRWACSSACQPTDAQDKKQRQTA